MLTAILAAIAGVAVVALLTVALLKRQPGRAPATGAGGSAGEGGWMFVPIDGGGGDSGACSSSSDGGSCGGD